jgi:hypothetical protein
VTLDEVHEEALAEHARWQEAQERRQNRRRSALVDLADARAALGLSDVEVDQAPDLGDNLDDVDGYSVDVGTLASEGEATGHWRRRDEITGTMALHTQRRFKRRAAQDVSDVLSQGHGYVVQSFSNPDRPEVCKFCGERLLTPAEIYPCEFGSMEQSFDGKNAGVAVEFRDERLPREIDGIRVRYFSDPARTRLWKPDHAPTRVRRVFVPNVKPTDSPRDCECNGCTRRRMGDRKRGGQPIQCGKPDCKKALRKEQNERAKQRRHAEEREAATELIRDYPEATDTDIARSLSEDLGRTVAAKRVREARSKASS